MVERVLVTGGTGKTGAALVPRLRAAGVEARIGTRRPSAPDQVRFDWRDAGSFDRALDGVDAVYLVAPTDTADSLGEMRPFLEAAAFNPRRLVLLSAAPFVPGGPMMGSVHSWLASHATNWAALRPSWFMQNFVTQALPGILGEGALYSATGDGRVPFIDAKDIAGVAAAMLTSPRALEGVAPILTGPEPLSYADVAAMISAVSGRAVRHVSLNVGALARRYESFGLPSDYAAILAGMDGRIAEGAEDRVTGDVEAWTGRRPNDLGSFLQDHRDAFHVGVHN